MTPPAPPPQTPRKLTPVHPGYGVVFVLLASAGGLLFCLAILTLETKFPHSLQTFFAWVSVGAAVVLWTLAWGFLRQKKGWLGVGGLVIGALFLLSGLLAQAYLTFVLPLPAEAQDNFLDVVDVDSASACLLHLGFGLLSPLRVLFARAERKLQPAEVLALAMAALFLLMGVSELSALGSVLKRLGWFDLVF